MSKYDFTNITNSNIKVHQRLNVTYKNCYIQVNDNISHLHISILGDPIDGNVLENISIDVTNTQQIIGTLTITLRGSHTNITINDCILQHLSYISWGQDSCIIEPSSEITECFIHNKHGLIRIGQQCLISNGVQIYNTDCHGLVDLRTKKISNNRFHKVDIGAHCWLSANSTVLKNTCIGHGSIIGKNAVVSGQFTDRCLTIVGNPARITNSNQTWSFWPHMIDPKTQQYIDQYLDDIE